MAKVHILSLLAVAWVPLSICYFSYYLWPQIPCHRPNENKNMFILVADLKPKINKKSKFWQMFIFCHFRLWHECRCLYVISLIIYDRESHATGQIKTKIRSSLKPTLKPKIIKKVKCGKCSYFVTFGRGMSAAVYMLFLLLFMTANLMPQAK